MKLGPGARNLERLMGAGTSWQAPRRRSSTVPTDGGFSVSG